MMTGSADREVKFWAFELAQGNLTLTHTRTLKMSDDVLAVRYTPTTNQQKLCVSVALLDHTIKVFYDDSLSFFLSLYGHKLPVMSLDISDDGTLLISGSADKVRIFFFLAEWKVATRHICFTLFSVFSFCVPDDQNLGHGLR